MTANLLKPIINNHKETTRYYFVAAIVMAITLTCSALFIPKQTLWIDEVTQLSGLTLNPIEVVSWLTGEESHRFGVPPDRTPPLSYWIGWNWSKLFGLNETSLRWLGALLNLLSVLILFTILYKQWGLRAATVLGLAFGLSPNLIGYSVEIRAYPLFLLLSCGSLLFFIDILKQPTTVTLKPLSGLTGCLILAVYTHFYGVVLTSVLLSVLLFLVWRTGGKIKPLLIASGIIGIAALGIIPFILASVSISHDPSTVETTRFYLKDTLRLIYRLIGHPTMAMSQIVTAIACISVISLLISSLKIKDTVSKGLWLSLLLGLIIVTATNFLLFKFNPTAPHYNLWMIPTLYLIMANGLNNTQKSPSLARIPLIAGILLIVSNAYGISQLIVQGQYFSHGPHKSLTTLIEQLKVENVSIIYEKSNKAWGFVYFPLYYEFNTTLPQYLEQSHNTQDITVKKLPQDTVDIYPTAITTPYALIIQVKKQDSQAVKQHILVGSSPVADGLISSTFRQSEQWQFLTNHTIPSFVTAQVIVFKRR